MAVAAHDTVLTSLESLEGRLERITYFLSGDGDGANSLHQEADHGRQESVQVRLSKLEAGLNTLVSSSPVARDLLHLQAAHPDLFQPPSIDAPTTLSPPEQLAVINSCATSFPTTASRLNAIKDLPIPPAESSTSLITLLPRLAKLELLQDANSREMAELRRRTAAVIQRWYELGVLGEGECWTEWEGRVANVEKLVRRKEMQKTQEEKEAQAYQS